MADIWELGITTYVGIAFNAEHFYGKLNAQIEEDLTYELYRVISDTEAILLNNKDQWDSWKTGDDTNRFDSRKDVIDAAMAVWGQIKGNGDALLIERHGNPSLPLDGPGTFVAEATVLYERYEKLYEKDGISFYPSGT